MTRGITNLVAIGGDGTLTGANKFREEWQELIKELVETGRISQVNNYRIITRIGLRWVGCGGLLFGEKSK